MKQDINMRTSPEEQAHGDVASLFNLLIVLAKYKKLIFRNIFAAVVLSAGGSLLLPDVYQGSTKLLPPQQSQSTAGILLSQLGGMAGAAAGITGLKNPNDMYVGMLQSRTVADSLIKQFNLKKIYETDSQEIARKKLEDRTNISSGKDGLITITVEDHNKQLVAPLANAYVSELQNLTGSLALTDASQRRVFYERELEKAKDNLVKSEIALKQTLNTRGVSSVDVESRTLLETASRIKAQVAAKEIQINSMRPFMTANNPEVKRAEHELSSLQAQVSKLENGSADDPTSGTDAANKGGMESIKLLRDVKYYQMLYDLLAKQYEISRLDEAKDPSIIQVLDQAVEPERKAKPSRALIVLLSALVTFLGSVLYAFCRETWRSVSATPEGKAKLAELKSGLRAT